MMTVEERERAIVLMQQAADAFYRSAVSIGNHPFIEFAGLMNEYITACRIAHRQGIDFSECNGHSGQMLPFTPVMSDYVNEKLGCIFSGTKIIEASLSATTEAEPPSPAALRTRGTTVDQIAALAAEAAAAADREHVKTGRLPRPSTAQTRSDRRPR